MKIDFVTTGCITLEEANENHTYAVSLGFPFWKPGAGGGKPLAIVGGGPSLVEHLDELRSWEGEIWAINSTYGYLLDFGILSTFCTADPYVIGAGNRAKRAVVNSACAPELFDVLKDHGADVTLYKIGFGRDEIAPTDCIAPGATTATMSPLLAAKMGYGKVTFFGCDGSWPDNANSHAYEARDIDADFLRVHTTDGNDYWTEPGFLMQAESIATFIRKWPEVYTDRSAGLVSSLVRDLDYDITHVSNPLNSKLRFEEVTT